MIFPLADSDDSAVKVIFGAIFVFIWIVSSLMSAASKKREEERRRRVRESIQFDRALPPQLPLPPPVQAQPPMQQAPPVMLRRIDLPRQQPTRSPKPQKARRKVIAPPPIKIAQQPRAVVPAGAPVQARSTITVPPAPAAPAPANASSLRSWLKPMTMRQQFILTEILQPPISMR